MAAGTEAPLLFVLVLVLVLEVVVPNSILSRDSRVGRRADLEI
jgi:hypothetical protein